MAAAVYLALLFFTACVVYLLYRAHRPPLYDKVEHLNGPKRYPIVGAAPCFFGKTANDCYNMTRKWYFETYSSPMLLKALDQLIVFVYDANQVEAIFKSRTNITKMQPLYSQISEWTGDSVLTGTGPKWHHRRRLLTPTFHYDILKDFAPVMQKNAMKLVNYYLEREGQFVDVKKPVTLTALDTLAETSVGRKFHSLKHWENGDISEGEKYVDMLNEFMSTIPLRRRSLLHRIPLYYALSQANKHAMRTIAILHKFTKSIISEREQSFKDGHIMGKGGKKKRLTLMDTLLALKTQGQMNTEEVRTEVDTFMFAGHDTTSAQLIFLSFKFGTEKEWQRRCQEEIDSVVGDDPVSVEHLNGLATLERFIKETLRMYPSVGECGRTLDEDLEIEPGVILPKGVSVFVQIQGLHMNKKYWDHPERFDPDRFLLENSAKRHPFAYVPFAAGFRNCIGQRFALMELKIVMATVLQHLDLHCEQTWEDLQPHSGAVFMIGQPCNVKFTRRNKTQMNDGA